LRHGPVAAPKKLAAAKIRTGSPMVRGLTRAKGAMIDINMPKRMVL